MSKKKHTKINQWWKCLTAAMLTTIACCSFLRRWQTDELEVLSGAEKWEKSESGKLGNRRFRSALKSERKKWKWQTGEKRIFMGKEKFKKGWKWHYYCMQKRRVPFDEEGGKWKKWHYYCMKLKRRRVPFVRDGKRKKSDIITACKSCPSSEGHFYLLYRLPVKEIVSIMFFIFHLKQRFQSSKINLFVFISFFVCEDGWHVKNC